MVARMNPESRKADADGRQSRPAARSAAEMTGEMFFWLRFSMALMVTSVVLSAVILYKLFALSAMLEESNADLVVLGERMDKLAGGVGRLEGGQQEILALVRDLAEKSGGDSSKP